ncbi:MAG TPA: UDP-2,3-diacylglucosamine diphosphatase [Terriglobales bacterium]|nr:UDP-2,3-diacylglucosamine diphosphatase [Terriglobales bacterium]
MDSALYDTLILSDVHLGAETSRARDATNVLRENRFRRLILLGDIFADLNFGRLTKEHWKFLGYIRKLSNPKRKIEIVWVEGNHDLGLTDVMSHLVGVKVYQEYVWDYAGLRHLAIHGHQFDGFAVNSMRLSHLGTLLYLQIQKFDLKGKPIARLIDRLNTRWLRMSPKVASGALNYASTHGADRIFCGHTHQSMHQEQDGVHYYNSGGWVDSKPAYLTVGEEGVRIHEYRERSDDRDSSEERGEIDSGFAEFAGEPELLEDAEYESISS